MGSPRDEVIVTRAQLLRADRDPHEARAAKAAKTDPAIPLAAASHRLSHPAPPALSLRATQRPKARDAVQNRARVVQQQRARVPSSSERVGALRGVAILSTARVTPPRPLQFVSDADPMRLFNFPKVPKKDLTFVPQGISHLPSRGPTIDCLQELTCICFKPLRASLGNAFSFSGLRKSARSGPEWLETKTIIKS